MILEALYGLFLAVNSLAFVIILFEAIGLGLLTENDSRRTIKK